MSITCSGEHLRLLNLADLSILPALLRSQHAKKRVLSRKHMNVRLKWRSIEKKKSFRAKKRTERNGKSRGAHSINWCKFLCTIMSCTLFMVLSSRFVSVALVKCT
jgi:hypothetical protein